MNQRARGALSVTGVLTVAGGIAVGAAMLPEQIGVSAVSSTVSNRLPAAMAVPTLACSGPETLVVPEGGKAVSPDAGVLISALLASEGEAEAELQAEGKNFDAIRQLSESVPKTGFSVHPGTRVELENEEGQASVAGLSTWNLGPIVMTAEAGRSGDAPELAAVQSTLTAKGDLRGLSASRCDQTSGDAWLVGGGTRTGQRLRLVLSNPTASAAVVDVTVLGADGRVEAPSGDGVVVPAGGQTPLFVDALAPDQERVAVHVVARSGQVVARMHDSRLRGLVPSGVDVVSPSAEPARRQLIPGISLVNGYSRTADDPAAPGSTSVRVAVPGSEEAVVRVRLLSSSGEAEMPTPAVLNIPGGGVADVPVSGIASGTYTAVVEADVPVVAAAQIGRLGSPGRQATEFGWAPAVPALDRGGYSVLPAGSRATVSLVAAGPDSALTITPIDAEGRELKPVKVEMKKGTGSAFPLEEKTAAFRMSRPEGGPVAASLVATSTDESGTSITVLGVQPASADDVPATAVADTRVGLR
ncbi:hypothetical protein Kisp01_18570 [Kineosporia sp. NBRC 101677]|uniref:DUF5719 family protein n=1 Tax=Kineosporia sp. NBRC 101677 TaxID=3032197 RepID=UPI0024A58AED|nr:DUF5719 family protein [Kineosporia sp. NBRC 101677]GLY14842.1 hypothetical protein Kisp01_18570 [Kineosporia sp. NBRC 101677]